MTDLAFVDAEYHYLRGDSRPLAKWVRDHGLTPDQREFVAQIIEGAVAMPDRRKHQPNTEKVLHRYAVLKGMTSFGRQLKRSTESEDFSQQEADHARTMWPTFWAKDSVIFRMIDTEFGHKDGTARRTVLRFRTRKKIASTN